MDDGEGEGEGEEFRCHTPTPLATHRLRPGLPPGVLLPAGAASGASHGRRGGALLLRGTGVDSLLRGEDAHPAPCSSASTRELSTLCRSLNCFRFRLAFTPCDRASTPGRRAVSPQPEYSRRESTSRDRESTPLATVNPPLEAVN
eukprot:782138-Prorocentrum_minimum.AAC.1